MGRKDTTTGGRLAWRHIVAAVCLAASAVRMPAALSDDPSPPPHVDFSRDIQPLLAKHCLLCHGQDAAQGGLRLHTEAAATAELDSGARGIVPGSPEASELLARVRSHDPLQQMPPEGERLTAAEIARLEAWIAAGAPWDQHWAYQPLQAPTPPEVIGPTAGVDRLTDIDRFVRANLAKQGIEPSRAADRPTLIRRLSYDLIGLPPETADVDAFVADASPEAYEQLVDSLLASPHFGERWGRHWLDMARFADSDGYEKDNHRPDAWRYRDWVIEAINRDLPFDQFTIEQLAGDLLPDATPQQLLATAFHRQTLTNTEGGVDREQFRVAAVMDRTETLGTVWLGLSVGCARCHSHKYDQITHREYYELYAFFNNADEVDAPFPADASAPPALAEDSTADAGDDAPKTVPVRVVRERQEDLRATHILRRGEFKQPLDEVTAGTLTTLPPVQPRDGREEPDRLDLARWLVDGTNPLVPRVAANHIWKHLFGEGLVATMNDFGVRGDPPSHPALLDHLASRLITLGWSRKALIKEIVMSATYQQSSRHRPELAEVDATNRLLHRQNRFRVEAEIVRDISLAAAGLLSPTVGGPSVFPPIPAGVTDLTYNSSFTWKTSQGDDRYRRGLYTYFKRTAPHPNLITFDCPDSNVSNVARDRSNTPIAALVTLNNATFVEAAQALARRTLAEPDLDDTARLQFALRRCIARVPTPEELADFASLLTTSRTWFAAHPSEAEALSGAAPALDTEPAENAAWITVVRVMLNLDEFLTRD
jgi:mono/diheme cytochrome c family protein